MAASTASPPSVARADEPILVGPEAGFWFPVGEPQASRFGVGGSIGGVALFPVNPWLLPSARLRFGFFADGSPPPDTTLRDPGIGGLQTLSVGLRLRPHGFLYPFEPMRGRGGFIEIDAGLGLTGNRLRPAFELQAGWGFDIDMIDLAPFARFIHVLHYDDALDSRNAFILQLGVEVLFNDARIVPHSNDDPMYEPDSPTATSRPSTPVDENDQCPGEDEDMDGFQDEDGCLDADDDQDGIPDVSDACRLEPEDLDGVADEDGCPETDADHDGFLDPDDRCPLEAEVVNGIDDNDGCPDEGLIQLVNDRILIEENVLFDLNRSRVKMAARPVLQAIANLVAQHPEWAAIRVEGHADIRGTEEWNFQLSTRRARQVELFLERLGVNADVLTSQGFGATRPRVEGDDEAAHAANRRVEIVVTARREEVRP